MLLAEQITAEIMLGEIDQWDSRYSADLRPAGV